MRKFRPGRFANDNGIGQHRPGSRRRLILALIALGAITATLFISGGQPASTAILTLFLSFTAASAALSIWSAQRAAFSAVDRKLTLLHALVLARLPERHDTSPVRLTRSTEL